jgi:hypothetical protein
MRWAEERRPNKSYGCDDCEYSASMAAQLIRRAGELSVDNEDVYKRVRGKLMMKF